MSVAARYLMDLSHVAADPMIYDAQLTMARHCSKDQRETIDCRWSASNGPLYFHNFSLDQKLLPGFDMPLAMIRIDGHFLSALAHTGVQQGIYKKNIF